MVDVFEYIVQGITFKVIFDKEAILMKMLDEKLNYTENKYVDFDKKEIKYQHLSHIDYKKNVEAMIPLIEEITTEDYLTAIVLEAPRKQNGTFIKKRVLYREDCKNTVYDEKWQVWRFYALKVFASTDTTLVIDYVKTSYAPYMDHKNQKEKVV